MTDRDNDAARASHLRPLLLLFGLLMPFSMGVRQCEDVPQDPGGKAGSGGPTEPAAGKGGGDGSTCGGLIGAKCASGQYCKFALDAHCGAADQTGTCTTIPQICTLDYSPVCGCDDKTYGNACGAAAAGVSVQRTGECESAAAGKGGSPAAGSGGKSGVGGKGGAAGKGVRVARVVRVARAVRLQLAAAALQQARVAQQLAAAELRARAAAARVVV